MIHKSLINRTFSLLLIAFYDFSPRSDRMLFPSVAARVNFWFDRNWRKLFATCHLFLFESSNNFFCTALKDIRTLKKLHESREDAFGTTAQSALKFNLWLMNISPLLGCASLCAVFFFSYFRVVHGVGNLTAAQHRENGISCATTAVLAIVVFHLFCRCFFASCLFTKQENEVVSQDVMNMLGQKTAESWGNFLCFSRLHQASAMTH